MRKKIKQYLLPGATFALNLLAALFWVAVRVNYSGISRFLGADTNPSFLVMNLPVMVCVLAWIACAGALAGVLLWHKKKWVSVTSLVLGVIVTVGAVVVVIFGAKDYLRFIMVHFWESLGVIAGILAFAAALIFWGMILNTTIIVVIKSRMKIYFDSRPPFHIPRPVKQASAIKTSKGRTKLM